MKDQFKVTPSTKVWVSSASKFKGKKFVGRYDDFKGDRVFNLWQFDPARRDQKPETYNSWQAAKKDGWSHDQE